MATLVGDPERDRAAQALQRHYREGRISVDELAQRLETVLHARNATQLRSALKELPGVERWATPEAVRQALRPPARSLRNAAILVGTAAVWLFWSIGMLVAFIAWLAGNGVSLGALLVFPLLWFAVSWLLWHGGKRRRLRP
jgi:Flp pilus assembly protein TadB